jgi:uncharacterized protein YbjT (DUF2867 family)
MKIVVIGGTGLIGAKLVAILKQKGHEAIAASPRVGINTLTGEGLAEALSGADVVVDVANSPSFEDAAVLKFFETSGRNLHAAEAAAGIKHHVALSVVGTDRLPDSGYMRAKLAQEKLIEASKIPYTIVRATQFHEFAGPIAQSGAAGQAIRLPPAMMQPIASDDVAALLADYTLGEPLNDVAEIAGPDPIRMTDLATRILRANGDQREVIADTDATYFGAKVDDRSLVPASKDPRLGKIRFDDWLKRTSGKAA